MALSILVTQHGLGDVFALLDDVFVFVVRGQFEQVNRLGVEPLANGVWKGAALAGEHVLNVVAQNQEAAVAVAGFQVSAPCMRCSGMMTTSPARAQTLWTPGGTVSAT